MILFYFAIISQVKSGQLHEGLVSTGSKKSQEDDVRHDYETAMLVITSSMRLAMVATSLSSR